MAEKAAADGPSHVEQSVREVGAIYSGRDDAVHVRVGLNYWSQNWGTSLT